MGDVQHVEPRAVQKRSRKLLMRDSALVSTGPNLEKSCAGTSGMPIPPEAAAAGPGASRNADLTSSLVMRPLLPVPLRATRSIPSSRAGRRTLGLAWTPPKSRAMGGGKPLESGPLAPSVLPRLLADGFFPSYGSC